MRAVISPELAREILDDKLWPWNDQGPIDEAKEVRLDFPDDQLAGWPYYLAMLEIASEPGEVAWVGWQLIAYYFIDAERFWPDNGESLVPVVSHSAVDSPRVGQLLSQWLCFAGSADSPAVTALVVEVLNRRFGWDLGPNLVGIRQSLRGGRYSVEYHKQRSDFSPPAIRAAIVACFEPSVRPAMSARSELAARWAHATNECSRGVDRAPGVGEIVRAIRSLSGSRCHPGSSDECVIARLLAGGLNGVEEDPQVLHALADALDPSLSSVGSIPVLVMKRLLAEPCASVSGTEESRASVWQALHPRADGYRGAR